MEIGEGTTNRCISVMLRKNVLSLHSLPGRIERKKWRDNANEKRKKQEEKNV